MKSDLSEEMLNAFVDQELSQPEMSEVLQTLKDDPQVAAEACALRHTKLLVRHAYRLDEAPAVPRRTGWRAWAGRACAMLCFLALGGLLGWQVEKARLPASSVQFTLAAPAYGAAPRVVSLTNVKPQAHDVLLHLDSDDPRKMAAALDYAQQILDQARRQGVRARIEIIANSYGLNLLRADKSPLIGRIDALSRQHANLTFVACGQSVARFQREGQVVRLIPQARVASSAVSEIARRLQEGWTYIQV